MSLGPSSRSVLGPLTTTWTPPSSCATYYPAGVFGGTQIDMNVGVTCSGATNVVDLACVPTPPVTSGASTTWDKHVDGIYSPGLVCPVGQTAACSRTQGDTQNAGAFSFQYPLLQGETAVGCCPVGYSCQTSSSGQWCSAGIDSDNVGSFTLATALCSQGSPVSTGGLTIPTASVYEGESITLVSARMYAGMLQLNYQSTDGVFGTPATTTTTSSTAPSRGKTSSVASSTAIANTTPRLSSTSAPDGSGNSASHTGAIAGGVVGGVLALLLIIGAAFVLVLRKRRTRKTAGPRTGPEMVGSTPAELGGTSARQELDAREIHEMMGKTDYARLPHLNGPSAELPA